MAFSRMRPAVLALTLAAGTLAFVATPAAATARSVAGVRAASPRPAAHAYRSREAPAPLLRAPRPSDHPDGTFPFLWLG